MPRNQSFMMTKEQYRNKTKTVTRRPGWRFAKVGDIVNGCEKCQGLRKGEKIVVMGQHQFTDLRWEPLRQMIDEPIYGKIECIREGFPHLTPDQFVEMFCREMKCKPETVVHRMEFRHLPVSIPVQIKWTDNKDIIITIVETGQPLKFIEGHCTSLIYVEFQGEQHSIETEKPWLMDGPGLLII